MRRSFLVFEKNLFDGFYGLSSPPSTALVSFPVPTLIARFFTLLPSFLISIVSASIRLFHLIVSRPFSIPFRLPPVLIF